MVLRTCSWLFWTHSHRNQKKFVPLPLTHLVQSNLYLFQYHIVYSIRAAVKNYLHMSLYTCSYMHYNAMYKYKIHVLLFCWFIWCLSRKYLQEVWVLEICKSIFRSSSPRSKPTQRDNTSSFTHLKRSSLVTMATQRLWHRSTHKWQIFGMYYIHVYTHIHYCNELMN